MEPGRVEPNPPRGGSGAERDRDGDAAPSTTLSSGELADRTGVSVQTLRMWERRHGFPTPARLDNGHRRYLESDVDLVRSVVRRRDTGTRLETAISLARSSAEPTAPSVFATLRRRHPHVAVHTLRKSTMLSVSWAIEDQFAALASDAVLYAAFQEEGHYRRAEGRWKDLAAGASYATVFADFATSRPDRHPREVAVPRSLPLAKEWAVVCHAVDLSVVLTAWELPGQAGTADPDRLFEACWTVEPGPVRDAAVVCAEVSADHGGEVAEGERLALEQPTGPVDPRSVADLYARVVAYVDRGRA